MITDCIECGRPAARYWGNAGYCSSCLPSAKRDDPRAHQCHRCGVEQPGNVSWFGTSPCGDCQHRERNQPPAGEPETPPAERPRRPTGFRKVRKPRWPGELDARPDVD